MNGKQLGVLPKTWIKTTIGAIYEVVGGGTPSTSVKNYWGGETPWITSADISGVRKINVSRYVTKKGIEKSTTNKVPSRTLLVVTRVGLGKIAISNGPMCFSQDVQGLVQNPDLILPEYSLHYLSFELQRLKFEGRGTTISGLTKKQLKDSGFPLPPYNEQRRIVAKIEALFSELDKGVESLKTAHEQLKVYRQAVLKHAFEGKLTAQWREENVDKLESPEQLLARIKKEREARYQQQVADWKVAIREWEAKGKEGKKPGKPRAPKPMVKLPDEVRASLLGIPDCWIWEKLGWMTCGVEYGTAAKSSESGSVPVIRMGNLQNGAIDWQDLVFTSDEAEIKQYLLKPGDVLFNRTNSPELVGKTAIYRGERPALFAGYLIRVNHIGAVVDGRYLNFFLNSHMAKQYGNTVKTDGVNQSNINGEKLQNYPFPYCSLAEQAEVVRVVEEKLSLTDRLMQDIDAELDKSNVLRQAILKKAFSGQLIPQDPNDEPASVLLERIKAEKIRKPTASRRSQESQGWYSRGYLPHFDAAGLVQHITFHLADSLPKEAIERMQTQIDGIPESERASARRKRIEALLDSGFGSCMLREAACAAIVEDSLLFGDGTRYRLLAWAVMPNHVHVLIEQIAGWPLAKVVQSWKRYTSRRIHQLGYGLGSPSCTRQYEKNADCKSALPLWQRDYWDRFIRDERHFLTAKRYIEANPVVAGLAISPEQWPWGSARFEAVSVEPSATRRSQGQKTSS